MRFGVVGLGSMGKRRVRDLLAAGQSVVGFDRRPDRCQEAAMQFHVATFPTFDGMTENSLDGCVISTPPDQHFRYYEKCYELHLPFFSEANVLTPSASWFAECEVAAGVRGYPSGTWRFHPLIALLREHVLAVGRASINTLAHQYGGYLPSWHPWESYVDFYAGRRETSAAREMVPFEMEALTWIFGPVKEVCAVRRQSGEWLTDMDDTYMLLLEFECGLPGYCSVELHQVVPFRLLRISTNHSSWALDLIAHQLTRVEGADGQSEVMHAPGAGDGGTFNLEGIYRAEIRAFICALKGDPYPKTWSDDRHLSNILVAAEESAERRAWVSIQEAETLHDGILLGG